MDTKLASAGFIQVDQETTQIIQLNMLEKRALCRKAHRYYMYRYINCKQKSMIVQLYSIYISCIMVCIEQVHRVKICSYRCSTLVFFSVFTVESTEAAK